MSVSNVINGKHVRAETRDAVLRSIEILNYIPNVAARALAGASPVRIGLLYNNPERAFVSALLVGAIEAATRFGAQVLIRKFGDQPELSLADTLRDMTRQGGANALILTAPYCEAISGTGLIAELNVPVTALCSGSELPDMPSIRIDDVEAAREMTDYLVGLGHRRIGFIRGAATHIINRTRYEGYCIAHELNNLEIDPDLVVNGDLTFDSGLDAAEKLLVLPKLPTAIFASNDDMAAAVISVAHRRNIRVPEQLSVAGFDDSPISRKIWTAVTTVRQPIME
jgi:LacI family transcriptional regulator